MDSRKNRELIKFRVRMTRIETKDVEVMATDMYKAQKIGRQMAETRNWIDFDNVAYSSLAEPWNVSEPRRRR